MVSINIISKSKKVKNNKRNLALSSVLAYSSLFFSFVALQIPTVFDRLREKIKEGQKKDIEEAIPPVQPKAVKPKVPFWKPTPQVKVPLLKKSVPEVKRPVSPYVEQPVTVPVHKTSKPLLVAVISIAAIGVIASLLFFGPKFVGKAIATVPNSAGLAVDGNTVSVGVNPVGEMYGIEVMMRHDSGLNPDIDSNSIIDVNDIVAGSGFEDWLFDVESPPGSGMILIRGFSQTLDPVHAGPSEIVQLNFQGAGNVFLENVRAGPQPIATIEPRMVTVGAAEAEAPPPPDSAATALPTDDATLPPPPTPYREIACGDGNDDDSDGLIDCYDPDCIDSFECAPPSSAAPQPPVSEICGVAGDEDGDGLIDCYDPDCIDYPACATPRSVVTGPPGRAAYEEWFGEVRGQYGVTTAYDLKNRGIEICGDGFDNDGDGLVDCADTDSCATYSYCLDVVDTDDDGVPDNHDLCPTLAGIGSDGCPAGAGGDDCVGWADIDVCERNMLPNTECSTDADGDGIIDAEDTDVDGDGQLNDVDADDDGDSVEDTIDLCPNTFLGGTVGLEGCLHCDVWDSVNEAAGRDGCVNSDDLAFVARSAEPGLICNG